MALGPSHFPAPHVELLYSQPYILCCLTPRPNLHKIVQQGREGPVSSPRCGPIAVPVGMVLLLRTATAHHPRPNDGRGSDGVQAHLSDALLLAAERTAPLVRALLLLDDLETRALVALHREVGRHRSRAKLSSPKGFPVERLDHAATLRRLVVEWPETGKFLIRSAPARDVNGLALTHLQNRRAMVYQILEICGIPGVKGCIQDSQKVIRASPPRCRVPSRHSGWWHERFLAGVWGRSDLVVDFGWC